MTQKALPRRIAAGKQSWTDKAMVLRTAGKGHNEGEDFHGCRNYLRGRQTFKLKWID